MGDDEGEDRQWRAGLSRQQKMMMMTNRCDQELLVKALMKVPLPQPAKLPRSACTESRTARQNPSPSWPQARILTKSVKFAECIITAVVVLSYRNN